MEGIQAYINKAVRAEHGMPMKSSDDKLVDTGIDSFGVVMVLLAVEDRYGVYSKDELKTIVIEDLTLGDMVTRIQDEISKTFL